MHDTITRPLTAEEGLRAGLQAHAAGDYADAAALVLPAAEAGAAEAQFWMGAFCANGEGVAANPKAAHSWCLLAARQGHVLAQANLARMLVQGFGVAQDPAEAARWLELAAQSDPVAQFELATLHARGRGVAEDAAAAAAWYRRAAAGGYYPAQARLGFLLANGIGVGKDRAEAFVWLSLAAQHGVGTALKALEEVGGQMSVEEKRRGSALLSQWRGRLGHVGDVRLDPVLG